ncbi:DNA helicase RecG domain protein [Mycobacterium xenopi 4042]|uniref:DNA helicase RecG domain protein n=1 Tax=Mycobacterium xenopi 4042 TaxID=1299334 RepID=X8DES9_MYCXE|nr:DNA helicase RecG domain protein [Mycobacterium xenopi 4042]
MLTGSMSPAQKKQVRAEITSGQAVSWSARTRFCKMPWSSTGWVW